MWRERLEMVKQTSSYDILTSSEYFDIDIRDIYPLPFKYNEITVTCELPSTMMLWSEVISMYIGAIIKNYSRVGKYRRLFFTFCLVDAPYSVVPWFTYNIGYYKDFYLSENGSPPNLEDMCDSAIKIFRKYCESYI